MMNEPSQKQSEFFQQQLRSKWNDTHHIVPRSRGGADNGKNKIKVNIDIHSRFHRLFSNRTPVEIIDFLVEYFWNGNISFIEKYLDRKGYNIVKKKRKLKKVSG